MTAPMAHSVAVGTVNIHDGIGWLGIGGTLPTHRKRGAQGALMAQRIRDTAKAGCKTHDHVHKI